MLWLCRTIHLLEPPKREPSQTTWNPKQTEGTQQILQHLQGFACFRIVSCLAQDSPCFAWKGGFQHHFLSQFKVSVLSLISDV